jgi:hypothetical protein
MKVLTMKINSSTIEIKIVIFDAASNLLLVESLPTSFAVMAHIIRMTAKQAKYNDNIPMLISIFV